MNDVKELKTEKTTEQCGQVNAIVSLNLSTENKYGYLWCLLNSMPELDSFAAIKLMNEIRNKLGEKKLDEYWRKYISG